MGLSARLRPRYRALAAVAERARRAALDLVYPPTCVSCHTELKPVGPAEERPLFCNPCLDELDLFYGPCCEKCGAPLPAAGVSRQGGCARCRDGPKLWFDRTIALGEYSGRLREMILAMKRREGNAISLAMGQLLWQHCREQLQSVEADVVVPVPMHWRRQVSHGTNSAAVLAEVLAGRLRVPLATGLLRRTRHTQPQSSLPATEKWPNVRGAFSVRAGYYLGRPNALLVDDILTTGATCSVAARELKRAGAARVLVAVVGRWLSH
jgi:ComF family protein